MHCSGQIRLCQLGNQAANLFMELKLLPLRYQVLGEVMARLHHK
jgi:hypothetical protein